MLALKKTWLRDIVYDRVDLVDAGANTAAHIKFYKRREDAYMNLEEILAKMTPEHAAIITAEIAKAKAEIPADTVTKLTDAEKAAADALKAKADLEGEVAKLKKEPPAVDEDVLKSLDPAVRAIVEKAQLQATAAEQAVKKMKEDNDTAESITKAAQLPNIVAPDAEGLAPVLKSLKTADSALFEQVFGILKAADALITDSKALEEIGKGKDGNSVGEEAAWAAIDKAASEIVVAQGITKAVAITQVMKNKPELYDAYIKAQTGK